MNRGAKQSSLTGFICRLIGTGVCLIIIARGCGFWVGELPKFEDVAGDQGEELSTNLSDEGIPRSTWPASWSEPPKTASEFGITKFKGSPFLDKLVASGELPSVEARLPDDPIVIEPAHNIGKHGGRARIFQKDVNSMVSLDPPLVMTPALDGFLPNLAKGWQFDDGGKTFTLFLRRGAKWSDGHPHTADDYLFWHRYVLMNEELTTIPPQEWRDSTAEKIDDYAVRFKFQSPYPFIVNELSHHGDNYSAAAHYLKAYHPDFTDREKLKRQASAEGYLNWMTFFNAVYWERSTEVFGYPTMRAYVLKRKTPTMLFYERNPYYIKIDPEGRQLPYIDQIDAEIVDNDEVISAKASTGQVDFAGNSLKTTTIPLFKSYEKRNGFKTYIWHRLHGVDVVIQPNLNHEDPELRKLFQDYRFRKALSISINRDEMNSIIYFNLGTPRQATVIPSSKFYEKSFATASIQYDPKGAEKLLDEIGIVDQDGDGYRDRPSGAPIDITLEWTAMETPKEMTMDLVADYWQSVGLDIRFKQIDGNIQGRRARANLMDMTLWHADRTTDVLFPPQPYWFVPMHSNWEECHWALWSNWYRTNGEEGEKPPEKIMELLNWWIEMRTSMDQERRIVLGKNILRSTAENLWTIGTIGLAPHPLIVKNRLKNVTVKGYWGWDSRWTLPYHPWTWYLDEEEAK